MTRRSRCHVCWGSAGRIPGRLSSFVNPEDCRAQPEPRASTVERRRVPNVPVARRAGAACGSRPPDPRVLTDDDVRIRRRSTRSNWVRGGGRGYPQTPEIQIADAHATHSAVTGSGVSRFGRGFHDRAPARRGRGRVARLSRAYRGRVVKFVASVRAVRRPRRPYGGREVAITL